jgi:pimeloyl-ACP methyl ester carboxylesterase
MRIFEILLAVTTLSWVLLTVIRRKEDRHITTLETIIVLLIVILHIILEGIRWQMGLIYLVMCTQIVFCWFVRKKHIKPRSGMFRTSGTITAILLIAISSVISISLPVFKLPEPTGKYDIGTAYYFFIDTNRQEIFTSEADDAREVPFQVWYPAIIDNTAQPKPYLIPEASKHFAKGLNLPAFLFDYLKQIRTHTYENMPVAKNDRPYPILIFNPGYGGSPGFYTTIIEGLVSQGYIVVSIPHVDGGSFYTLPDGRIQVSPINNSAYHEEAFGERVEFIKRNLTQSKTMIESEFWYQQLLKNSPINQSSVRVWADDISFVIDQLFELNKSSERFAGYLDLEKIGVFGHSFGGAASAQATINDDRISAGINMDGFQYGDLFETPINKPFMFITAEHASEGIPFPSKTNLVFIEQAEAEVFNLFIKGSEHHSFTDIPLWGDFLSDARHATINSRKCLQLTQEYLLVFFDTYLQKTLEETQDILALSHPEVIIEPYFPQQTP